MLFDATVRLFLLGLSTTAVISLFAAIGTQSRPKHLTFSLHCVIVGIYLPLLWIALNELPLTLIPTLYTAWLVTLLASFTAVTAHALIIARREIAGVTKALSGSRGARSVDTFLHEPPKSSQLGYILVNSSVAHYREAVLLEEEKGRDFAYIQRRIAPYLYSDSTLQAIARQRFGAGNPEMNAYISAHQRRRQSFFASIESGARYREMFQRQVLLRYIETGTHADEMWPISSSAVVDLLKNWRQVLLQYPNYYVGISDQSLPIKYHLIDGECVILHEPVGKGDDIRLNSFFMFGRETGMCVQADFDLVWGLIDPEWRDRERIARWIKDELIPLARRRSK
jgi:hypothetical protein